MSLSKELLALFTTTTSNPVIASFDTALSHAIINNSAELDAIGVQSRDFSLSEDARARLGCKAGQLVFGTRAITPEDPAYEKRQQENWSTMCWLPAACFVQVQTPLEVAVALRLVTSLKSKFAVRSRGHNANPGFSSINETGILIDLGAMNSVTLSSDNSIASIGPGAVWDEVYEQLEEHELTVPGGRVKGVGVGGLVLGGGMSHFSNHWGLVADNLQNVELVLADSSIVQVNCDNYPDLFKALKGGGPNFGIATRYDIRTDPNYRLWYTLRVFNVTEKARVMEASVAVEKAMETNDKIGFFLSVTTTTLTAGMLYREWLDFPEVFRVFDGIPVMMEVTPPTNGTQFSLARSTAIEAIVKYAIGTITLKPNAALYEETHTILKDIAKTPNVNMGFTFQPLGAATVAKGQANGGNIINMPSESQSWLGLVTTWTDDALDETAHAQVRQFLDSVKSAAKSHNSYLDFKYQNDASYYQNPLKTYGAESLEYMNQVASKYDPTGIFQQLQQSGFLLSKV